MGFDWAQPQAAPAERSAPAPERKAPAQEEIAVTWSLTLRDGTFVEDIPVVVHIPTVPELIEIGNRTAAWFGGVAWDSIDPETRSLAHQASTVAAMLASAPPWLGDALQDDPVLLGEVYGRLTVIRGLYWNGARQALGSETEAVPATAPAPDVISASVPVLPQVVAPLKRHSADSLREALAAAAAAVEQTKRNPMGLEPVVYHRPTARPAEPEQPEEDALVGAQEG